MSETSFSPSHADLLRYHELVKLVNSDPRYTSGSRIKRLLPQLGLSSMDRALSPQETAYRRAHEERVAIRHAANAEASRIVSSQRPPHEDGGRNGKDWEDGADILDTMHYQDLDTYRAAPAFANDVRERTVASTGIWLGGDLEQHLANPGQPHLYARAAAEMIAKTFGDNIFHEFEARELLQDRGTVNRGFGVLARDGVIQGANQSDYERDMGFSPNFYRADLGAIALISGESVYVPPSYAGPRPTLH
jgi:hypothetical protein